nr:unnamed protein product [Callosobruchus analis]
MVSGMYVKLLVIFAVIAWSHGHVHKLYPEIPATHLYKAKVPVLVLVPPPKDSHDQGTFRYVNVKSPRDAYYPKEIPVTEDEEEDHTENTYQQPSKPPRYGFVRVDEKGGPGHTYHPKKEYEERNDYYDYPLYRFGYGVRDPKTGDYKSHHESRDGDVVKGFYTVLDPDGALRIVRYTADDKHGFRAVVDRQQHPSYIGRKPKKHPKAYFTPAYNYDKEQSDAYAINVVKHSFEKPKGFSLPDDYQNKEEVNEDEEPEGDEDDSV